MKLKLCWVLIQIALTVAMTACGGANQEHYNDRKIYVYTQDPPGAAGSADATATSTSSNQGASSKPSTDSAPPPTQSSPQTGDIIASGNLIGALDDVTDSGRISGWGAWDQDDSVIVTIVVAIDGVEIASNLPANVDGFDGNTSGSHAFTFNLPDQYKDDNDHELLVTVKYGTDSLEFAKQVFKLSAPSQAGRDFFAANLQATLQNRCGGCHPVNYEQQYAALSTPLPTNGGTITDNELINMASGRNGGTIHPGGNICGSKTTGVCLLFQQWWTIEFGG